MDLILIRHARPALPGDPSSIGASICYGRLDLALAAPCSPALADIAAPLRGFMPSRIVTSPALRARDTAEGLARTLAVPVPCEIEPRLQELDFGAWEGMVWDDVPRADLDAWAADLMHARPHGGESAAQGMARVSEWVGEWASEWSGERGGERGGDGTKVAPASGEACWWVVAHAGPIRMLAAHWLGVPLARTLQWSLGFGASCCLRLQGGQAQLIWWNRTVD